MAACDAVVEVEIEEQFSTTEALAAHPDLSEGDQVMVTFDNTYDARYSDETTMAGEVTWIDADPSTGVVVLRLERERNVQVNSHGEVSVQNEPKEGQLHSPRFNTVGELVEAERL